MWTDLAIQCAPGVSPVTVEAIIRVESKGNPLAINVNRVKVQPVVPKTAPGVARVAAEWIARGFSVDLGLMQINSANLSKLGLTVEQVLDPCTNIKAGAAVLADGYERAKGVHGDGQKALQAALSAYNTGDLQKGWDNGYVAKYYAPTGIKTGPAKASAVAHRPLPGGVDRNNPYTASSAVAWE
jgi:type IV secretion system protein VirB1